MLGAAAAPAASSGAAASRRSPSWRRGSPQTIGGVEVTAVEAEHGGGRGLALRSDSEAIGFVLSGTRRAYFAGDTDLFDGDGRPRRAGSTSRCCRSGAGARPSAPGHLDPERAARAAAML